MALVDASSAYFMIFLHLIDLYYSLKSIKTPIDLFFKLGRFRIEYILFTREYFTSEVIVDNYFTSFTDRNPYCTRRTTYQGPRIVCTTTTIRKGTGVIETIELGYFAALQNAEVLTEAVQEDSSRIRKATRYADGNVVVEEKVSGSRFARIQS